MSFGLTTSPTNNIFQSYEVGKLSYFIREMATKIWMGKEMSVLESSIQNYTDGLYDFVQFHKALVK